MKQRTDLTGKFKIFGNSPISKIYDFPKAVTRQLKIHINFVENSFAKKD
ncbi:hypothetical protein NMYAN_310002 [Nitrosomonas nitrosa]|uniref:Uncharacterized protein n=1 Tax=Nitrosomonas nitrosa TaxID=52442 RepID=A0A8H9DAM8_9PROT|nr:hypothetical protein NMYAN_310002 [Nitrosomonas nitrosa]